RHDGHPVHRGGPVRAGAVAADVRVRLLGVRRGAVPDHPDDPDRDAVRRGDDQARPQRPARGVLRPRRPALAGGPLRRPADRDDRHGDRRDAGGRPRHGGDRPAAADDLLHQGDQQRPVQRPAGVAAHLHLGAGRRPQPELDRPGLDRRARPDRDHHAAQPAGTARRPIYRGEEPLTRRERTTDPMAKRIDVSGLHAYYGPVHAVEDVSMTIEPRSVTAFIGSSGCGKSTFLRTLNRMHEVTPGARVEGKVLLDDQDIYAPDVDPVEVRREVGMVFQRPNPFPTMSIYDNVIAGYKLNNRRLRKSEADEIVERSLRGANLWEEVKDRLDRPGASLSGGQQQRLCIARAIAVEPSVLLMDEPCSALD